MDTDKVIQDLNRRFAAPLPEFYQDFVKYHADGAFWAMVRQGCGFCEEEPDLGRLAIHLLLTAATRTMRQEYLAGLDGFISMPHQAYCYDFISEWLHSNKVNSGEVGRQGEPVRAGRCPGAEGGLGRDIQQLYDVARYVEITVRFKYYRPLSRIQRISGNLQKRIIKYYSLL